jgi:hypothetical protein
MKNHTRRYPSILLIAAALISVSACATDPGPATDVNPDVNHDVSGDTVPVSDTTPPSVELTYNPCTVEDHVGGFQITLDEAYTGINGQVLDGIVPANIPDEVQVEGTCRLMKARILFCDPGCVPGETCGADGTCITYPASHPVGTVTVSGLKENVTMDAKWGNHYTNPGTLPHPGFDAGAKITLEAAGGDYEPFTLLGQGVTALEIPASNQNLVIVDNKDIELKWTPSSTDGPIKMRVEVNINNHGSTSAWIECEADDTGAFAVPGNLVTELKAVGVSGFPSIRLSRRSADSTSITPGCVQLLVASEHEYTVELEGLTSCTKDSQCPKGQSCGVDLSCQ